MLYRGELEGNIGDFTDFNPADSVEQYVIDLSGGALKPNTSDPFLICAALDQKHYWQPVVDFLIDSRAVVGTHPSAYGGRAWRDGAYYDAIVPGLVMFYLSDPEFIQSMPKQLDWEADKKRVTSPKFKFDSQNPLSEGVMDAVKDYYQLEPPHAGAPDVVKLIHWGAGYILMKPEGRDPSHRSVKKAVIHSQTVEQVSYVILGLATAQGVASSVLL